MVSYEYDSWSKILSIKDNQGNEITDENNIGLINPFRYRSYYYDIETELYYLNSRYYNPEWKRFISADNYISTGAGHLGYNMYIYTNNNSIKYIDKTGHAIGIGLLIGIVAVGSLIIGNTVYQNKKAKKEINNAQKKKKKAKKNNTQAQKFSQTLKTNAATVQKETKSMNPVQKLSYFIDNVKTGGTYDLKNTDEWEETVIYYNNLVLEPQDIGNYNFGYIGRAMGYDVDFLTAGAGLYQMAGNTRNMFWCFTPSLCDDPRDSYYIRLGAIAYDEEH